MLEPKLALYAFEHCNKYPSHNLKLFIKKSIDCKHILLNDCCLVQYIENEDYKIIYHILFDNEKCDFKLSIYKNIRKWFTDEKYILMFEPIDRFKKVIGLK
jgi:hypothetical protein